VKDFGLKGPVSVAACLATALALSGCGASPSPAERAADTASAPVAAPAALPTIPLLPPRPGLATTCAPLLGHAAFAAQSCESCHPCGVKATSGHPAAWTDRTSAGFHAYSANAGLSTCQGCHGVALDGVGGSATTSCAQCHGATWKTNCVMCHGGTDNQTGAPAKATWGNSADAVRVGTHTAHVAATHGLGAAVACATCHVQPVDALSAGHVDGGTAEVVFSGRAIQGVVTTPAWTRATATCSNTYCHGATLTGGTATAPIWTRTDGTQRACTSCHGAPPPNAYHTRADLACAACHVGYTATTVNGASHLNGTIDYAVGCTTCHGNSAQAASQAAPLYAAPPTDAKGNTAITARGVGTHQIHLVNGTLRNALACSECHTVPSSQLHANGTVEVIFGALAKTGAANPAWNGASCSASYCHGNFKNGNTTYAPTWTVVAANKCGTCHGTTANPAPGGTHPSVAATSCGTCHTGYTGTTVNLTNHMNGTVEVTSSHPAGWNAGNQHGYQANLTGLAGCMSCHGTDLAGGTSGVSCTACHTTNGFANWATNCTFCHGSRTTGRQSPPVDIQGRSVATNVSVGRHDKHVATTMMTPIACGECHVVPTTSVITDAAHIDGNGIAEVTFGTLARTGGKVPVYTRTSATASGCSATYCHGNFTGGSNSSGTGAALSWVSATALTCTACHGAPPSTGQHQTHQQGKATNCQHCHSGIATGTGYPSANAALVPAGIALHVNGAKNLAFGGTYSGRAVTMTVTRSGTRITCTGSCHGSKTW
jgi:predicted CxxxxCH...CXXCH cytochrome family protein